MRPNLSLNSDGTPKHRVGLDIPSGQLLITKVLKASYTSTLRQLKAYYTRGSVP
jgi:hypothetical protein